VKIGILDLSMDGWSAGEVYSSILFQSLRESEADVYFLSDGNKADESHQLFPSGETYLPGEWTMRKILGLGRKNKWVRTVRNHNISVFGPILHPELLVGSAKNMAWIPDLQPFFLPHLYQQGELSKITRRITRLALDAHKIIFSSLDSKEAFAKLFPGLAGKSVVLSFPSILAFEGAHGGEPDVREKYGLPKKFLLVANQFWKHKNHRIISRAMVLLKREGLDVPFMVLTGLPADFRDRNNTVLSEFLQEIACAKLHDRICVLGLVPRADLIALLRTATGIFQPSLFEGWNTTVEDAKALDCPLILSDIPVHREQAPGAHFFDPTDPISCAGAIANFWSSSECEVGIRSICEHYLGYKRDFCNLTREVFEN